VVSAPNLLDIVYMSREANIAQLHLFGEAPERTFMNAFSQQRNVNAPFAPVRQAQDLKQEILPFVGNVEPGYARESQGVVRIGWPRGPRVISHVERIAYHLRIAERAGKLKAAKFHVALRNEIRDAGSFVALCKPFGYIIVRPPAFGCALCNHDVQDSELLGRFHPKKSFRVCPL
jgi:hypothetical protein